MRLFNRQFLLTKEKCDVLGWKSVSVAEYHLYTHPNLELTIASNDDIELFLLGFFFDYRHPERTNSDILQFLLCSYSFEEILNAVDELSGHFVFMYKSQTDLRLFHDAGGQREIFYDTTYSAFGSQPKLIEKVIIGEELKDPMAIEFYGSELFHKFETFVGDSTHRENIKHLLPNHLVDVRTKSVHRYFPVTPIRPSTIDDAAQKAVEMLQGYLKAASLRYPLEIGVTAGYDTRIIFLASRDLACERFVDINKELHNAIDIEFALKLGKAYGISVEVREQATEIPQDAREIFAASIDFPKTRHLVVKPSDKLLVNGLLNEITRNYFSNRKHLRDLKKVTGADLATMYRYSGNRYVATLYDSWLNANKALFERTGYNYLDFFYWEERMGNWGAKWKTEVALNLEMFAPFGSRALLRLLLSIDKKYRDKYQSKLHDAMIYKMSPAARKIPISPTKENKKIRIMKRLGLYEFDRKHGVISKILRHLPFK